MDSEELAGYAQEMAVTNDQLEQFAEAAEGIAWVELGLKAIRSELACCLLTVDEYIRGVTDINAHDLDSLPQSPAEHLLAHLGTVHEGLANLTPQVFAALLTDEERLRALRDQMEQRLGIPMEVREFAWGAAIYPSIVEDGVPDVE